MRSGSAFWVGIMFVSTRGSGILLYQKMASGALQEERLLANGNRPKMPQPVSPATAGSSCTQRMIPRPSGISRCYQSTAGGQQARWRGDGKELFFVGADRKMMSVAVKAGLPSGPRNKAPLEPGAPRPLFEAYLPLPGRIDDGVRIRRDRWRKPFSARRQWRWLGVGAAIDRRGELGRGREEVIVLVSSPHSA